MRFLFFLIFYLSTIYGIAQDIKLQLEKAILALDQDKQFAHASIAMLLQETGSGKIIYQKNEQLGMAPASCQKIVISAAALDLLGNRHQFITGIGYTGKIENTALNGNLVITGYGDPAFGSSRWKQTGMEKQADEIVQLLRQAGIKKINGGLLVDDQQFGIQPMPGGWIWDDMGNYYGAGARGFNWNENQYSIALKSGNAVGDTTKLVSISPVNDMPSIINLVSSAARGSGDNAYIYSAPGTGQIFITGTIPVNESRFSISGALPDPANAYAHWLMAYLRAKGIEITGAAFAAGKMMFEKKYVSGSLNELGVLPSVSLDSINYWFLKKSVNLFGEAFVRKISFEKGSNGNIDSGISIIRNYWAKRGVEPSALKIIDGSGLSPANRLTAHSLVTVLQYAKNKSWFNSFYNALPEMNGIKMKDGYIGGVRSYTGYIKSNGGKEYCFAFIVNNFDGSPATVRQKMWSILDLLKK